MATEKVLSTIANEAARESISGHSRRQSSSGSNSPALSMFNSTPTQSISYSLGMYTLHSPPSIPTQSISYSLGMYTLHSPPSICSTPRLHSPSATVWVCTHYTPRPLYVQLHAYTVHQLQPGYVHTTLPALNMFNSMPTQSISYSLGMYTLHSPPSICLTPRLHSPSATAWVCTHYTPHPQYV